MSSEGPTLVGVGRMLSTLLQMASTKCFLYKQVHIHGPLDTGIQIETVVITSLRMLYYHIGLL